MNILEATISAQFSVNFITIACVNILLVNILEATFLVQSSSNLVRITILTKSRSSSNMAHMGSKSWSIVQILEKACEHSRSHQFSSIFIRLSQNDHLDKIKMDMGHFGSNLRKSL